MAVADDDALDRPPNVEGGVISGRATDSKDMPLPGVRVEAVSTGGGDLDLLPELSDADGRFELTGLAEGRYDLRFSLGQVKARVLAVPTGTDQLRVRLARPQGLMLVFRSTEDAPPPPLYHYTLSRRVKDVAREEVVHDGLLCEDIGATLKSRVLLWSIRPGHYTVTVWGGTYLPVTVRDIEVLADQPAPVVKVLLAARGAILKGSCVLPASTTHDAVVNLRRLDQPCHIPRQLSTQEVGASGEFWYRGLPEGTYLVSAYREDLGFVQRQIDVSEAHEEGAPLHVELRWA